MQIQRSNFWYNLVQYSTQALSRLFYTPQFNGLKNIPPQGPALLLPRHQKYWDIIYEAELLTYVSRKGNWIMKDGLPKSFRLVGGISVKRRKDITLSEDRDKRRDQVEQARNQIRNVMDYAQFLYGQGEIVIMHPEGTRYKNKIGQKLKMNFVDHAIESAKLMNMDIPLIPIGINYYQRKVLIKIGEPLNPNQNNLETILFQEIKRLSCLK